MRGKRPPRVGILALVILLFPLLRPLSTGAGVGVASAVGVDVGAGLGIVVLVWRDHSSRLCIKRTCT
jgi:hypothetical protein